MTSAMTHMTINAAGSQGPRSRGSFSLGGAFGGGEKSAGVGFGVDL